MPLMHLRGSSMVSVSGRAVAHIWPANHEANQRNSGRVDTCQRLCWPAGRPLTLQVDKFGLLIVVVVVVIDGQWLSSRDWPPPPPPPPQPPTPSTSTARRQQLTGKRMDLTYDQQIGAPPRALARVRLRANRQAKSAEIDGRQARHDSHLGRRSR